LIHEVDELKDSDWETREMTLVIFEQFLKERLDLTLDKTRLIDIHRLPQRPVIKHGRKVNRPLIIKLGSMQDKHYFRLVKISRSTTTIVCKKRD